MGSEEGSYAAATAASSAGRRATRAPPLGAPCAPRGSPRGRGGRRILRVLELVHEVRDALVRVRGEGVGWGVERQDSIRISVREEEPTSRRGTNEAAGRSRATSGGGRARTRGFLRSLRLRRKGHVLDGRARLEHAQEARGEPGLVLRPRAGEDPAPASPRRERRRRSRRPGARVRPGGGVPAGGGAYPPGAGGDPRARGAGEVPQRCRRRLQRHREARLGLNEGAERARRSQYAAAVVARRAFPRVCGSTHSF